MSASDDWAYGVKRKTFTPAKPPTEKASPPLREVWALAVAVLGIENVYAVETRTRSSKYGGPVPIFRVLGGAGAGWVVTQGPLERIKDTLTPEAAEAWWKDRLSDAEQDVEQQVKALAEAYETRERLRRLRLPTSRTLFCKECDEEYKRADIGGTSGATERHCSTECASAAADSDEEDAA